MTWHALRDLGSIRQLSSSVRLSVHVYFIGGIDVVFTHLTICEVKIKQFAIMSYCEKLKITLLCLCTRQCFVFGEKNFSKIEKGETSEETEQMWGTKFMSSFETPQS